jgi:cation diffusion facilitator CzcD-associated flavoprotein CzcO
MPVEQVQTLVIGGGQAGLVMSHRLKQRGLGAGFPPSGPEKICRGM